MSREEKTRLNKMVAGRPGASAAAAPGKSSRTDDEEDGQPLPQRQRSVFEQAVNKDLGDVRVHTDDQANELANQHDARAFAQGQDIYFAAGEYDPSTPDGERLLAHEVAHTVQQADAPAQSEVKTTQPGDEAERNADDAATAMVAGKQTQIEAQPEAIAREKKGEKKKEAQPLSKIVTIGAPTFTGTGQAPRAVWRKDFKDQGVDEDRSPAEGKEMVSINAPEVTFKTTANGVASLDDVEFGTEPVQVGFIQNVTSLSRHGVYKKDGKQVAEYTQDSTKALHDQMTIGSNPDSEFKKWGEQGKGPWYRPPKVIENKTSGAELSMRDRPGFDLPINFGGGQLAEVKGADNFTTTVAAKRGAEIHNFHSREWSIPWGMQINTGPQGQALGSGKALEDAKQTDKHATIHGGPTAFELGEGMVLESLAAAMATDFHWLLLKLPMARKAAAEKLSDKHVQTYEFMKQAIQAKSPTYVIELEGDEFGMAWDNFTVTVGANKKRTEKGSTSFFGGKGKVSFAFADICDIEKYDGERITATVQIEGRKPFDEVNITLPVSQLALTASGSSMGTKNYRMTTTVQSR